MHSLLAKYLTSILHKETCVILPDFGGFVSNYTSAEIDLHTDFFTPPSLTIAFNQSLTHNDGLLIQEIAKQDNVTLEEAENRAQKLITLLRKDIYTNGRADLEGLGLLYLDKDYSIKFKVAIKANLLPQSYGLKSFRFSSIKNRRQLQSFENEYMKEPTVKKRTLVITTAAASVIILLGLTLFVNHKMNQESTVKASLSDVTSLNIDSALEAEATIDTKTGVEIETEIKRRKPLIDESSTRKSHALHYNEAHSQDEYHIIAGSFSNIESAKRYGKKLEDEGYSPSYITDGDKVRISIYSYDEKYEALKQLDFLRATKDRAVWMLKKTKEE